MSFIARPKMTMKLIHQVHGSVQIAVEIMLNFIQKCSDSANIVQVAHIQNV